MARLGLIFLAAVGADFTAGLLAPSKTTKSAR